MSTTSVVAPGPPASELCEEEVLVRAGAWARLAQRAGAQLLVLAYEWAVAHPAERLDPLQAGLPGRERAPLIGGPGRSTCGTCCRRCRWSSTSTAVPLRSPPMARRSTGSPGSRATAPSARPGCARSSAATPASTSDLSWTPRAWRRWRPTRSPPATAAPSSSSHPPRPSPGAPPPAPDPRSSSTTSSPGTPTDHPTPIHVPRPGSTTSHHSRRCTTGSRPTAAGTAPCPGPGVHL